MNKKGEIPRAGSRYVSQLLKIVCLVSNSLLGRPMVFFRYDVSDSTPHQDLAIPLRRFSDGRCGEAGFFDHCSLAARTANAPKSMVITYACYRASSSTKRVGHNVGTARSVTGRQRRFDSLAHFERGTGRVVRTVWIC